MSENELTITNFEQPGGENANEFLITYSNGDVQKITIVNGEAQYSYKTSGGEFTDGLCDAAKLINPYNTGNTALTYKTYNTEGVEHTYTIYQTGTVQDSWQEKSKQGPLYRYQCTDMYGNDYTRNLSYSGGKDTINKYLYAQTPQGKYDAVENEVLGSLKGKDAARWNEEFGKTACTMEGDNGEVYTVVVTNYSGDRTPAAMKKFIDNNPDCVVQISKTVPDGNIMHTSYTIKDGVLEINDAENKSTYYYKDSAYTSKAKEFNLEEFNDNVETSLYNKDSSSVPEVIIDGNQLTVKYTGDDGKKYTLRSTITDEQKNRYTSNPDNQYMNIVNDLEDGSLNPSKVTIENGNASTTKTVKEDGTIEIMTGHGGSHGGETEKHIYNQEGELIEYHYSMGDLSGNAKSVDKIIDENGGYTETEKIYEHSELTKITTTTVDGSGITTQEIRTYDTDGNYTVTTTTYNPLTGEKTEVVDPNTYNADGEIVDPSKVDEDKKPEEETSGEQETPAAEDMAGMMKWNTSRLGSVISDSDKLSGAKTQISNASTNLNGIDLSRNYGSIDISFVSTAKTSLETITGEHTTNTDEVTNEKDALTTCESDNLGLASIPTPAVISVSIPKKESETTKTEETDPIINPTITTDDDETETTDTELEDAQTDELKEKIDALKDYNIDTEKLTEDQINELYDALQRLQNDPEVSKMDKAEADKLIGDLLKDQLDGKIDINKISKDDLILLIYNPSNINEFFLMHKDEFDFIGVNKITLQTIFTLKDLDDKTAHDYSELQMHCVNKYKVTAEEADDLIEKFLNDSDLEDYETTVFILISNFINDPKSFEEKFGFPLFEPETQKLNTALLFVDLFMFLETQGKNSAEFSYIADEIYGDERFNVDNLNSYLESKGITDFEFVSNTLLGKAYLKNSETLLEGKEFKPRFRYLSRSFTEDNIESLRSSIAKSLDKGKAVIVNVDDTLEMLDEKMLTLKSINPNYQDTDLEHPGHLEVIGVTSEGIIVMHESREYLLTYDQIKEHDITIDEIELKEKEQATLTEDASEETETEIEETQEETETADQDTDTTGEEGEGTGTGTGTTGEGEGEGESGSGEEQQPTEETEEQPEPDPAPQPTPAPESETAPQPEQDIGEPPEEQPAPAPEQDIGTPPEEPAPAPEQDIGTPPEEPAPAPEQDIGEPPIPEPEPAPEPTTPPEPGPEPTPEQGPGTEGYETDTTAAGTPGTEPAPYNSSNQRPRTITVAYRGPSPENPPVDGLTGEGKLYNPPSYDIPVEPKPTPEDM